MGNNVFGFWLTNIVQLRPAYSKLLWALDLYAIPDIQTFDAFVAYVHRHGQDDFYAADALWADYQKWRHARLAPLPKKLPRELAAA
jgi:hypothetical protein